MWDTAKVIMTRNFIKLKAHTKKEKKCQINKLSSHLKNLEKEKQNKPKRSRRKKIIKLKPKINETENRKNK